jgi:hypothetical protein
MKNVGELTNQIYASMLEERAREQEGMRRVASPFLQVTNRIEYYHGNRTS